MGAVAACLEEKGQLATINGTREPAHPKARRIQKAEELSDCATHIRHHRAILRQIHWITKPDTRPDGSGSPIRRTEHRRGQSDERYLQKNGDEADKCRSCQPRGVAPRLRGLPPTAPTAPPGAASSCHAAIQEVALRDCRRVPAVGSGRSSAFTDERTDRPGRTRPRSVRFRPFSSARASRFYICGQRRTLPAKPMLLLSGPPAGIAGRGVRARRRLHEASLPAAEIMAKIAPAATASLNVGRLVARRLATRF